MTIILFCSWAVRLTVTALVILVIIGLIIIVLIKLFLVLIPAILVAVVVWLLTGEFVLGGHCFPCGCGVVDTGEVVVSAQILIPFF